MRLALRVVSRVLAAVFVGYGCASAAVGVVGVTLNRAVGLSPYESVRLSEMVGIPLYVGILLWAFVEPRLWRVWATLLGIGGFGYSLLWWSSPLVRFR